MTPLPSIEPIATLSPEAVDGVGKLMAATFGFVYYVLIISGGLWLISFIDILKSTFKDSSNKVVWILVSLLLPGLGPVLYFLVGRKQIKEGTGISLKAAFTILSFFIWFPIGAVLSWIWTKWPKWLKIVLTVLAALSILIRILAKI